MTATSGTTFSLKWEQDGMSTRAPFAIGRSPRDRRGEAVTDALAKFMEQAFSITPWGDRRPEMEIIFCCAQSELDEQGRDHLLEMLECKLDWGFLMRTADVHGVVPLLYQGLREEAASRVPPAVLKELQAYCIHSVAHSSFLTGKLFELLNLFAKHDIDAVPIKGPVLAATTYNPPALRSFCDLDIMVRRRDVLEVVKLLKSASYLPHSKSSGPERIDELLQSRLRKDAGFMREDGLVAVEIHWDFLPAARSFPLRPESIWELCENVEASGNSLPSFATEHVLVFLCAHGAKHGWMRLKWICDVAELIRTPSLDWDRVIDEAKRLRSERLLRLGLLLSVELLRAKLPEKALAFVTGDRRAQFLARDVALRLRAGQYEMERWEEALFWVKSREYARDKLPGVFYYLLRSVMRPTDRDETFVALPRPLYFLYYLVRPVRVFFDRQSEDAKAPAKNNPTIAASPAEREIV